MSDVPRKIHPHDTGLPQPLVRKRRQFRITGHWLLIVATLTGIPSWYLFTLSYSNALSVRHDPWQRVIFAYGLLITSSVTLLLGLWYLLLAQVRRIAREVHDEAEPENQTAICPNCGWPHDPPDRYCRHCGKPLGMTISPSAHGQLWERGA